MARDLNWSRNPWDNVLAIQWTLKQPWPEKNVIHGLQDYNKPYTKNKPRSCGTNTSDKTEILQHRS